MTYEAYRESGLDWLVQLPAHWGIQRNGRLFAQRNETGFGHLPILEVSLRTGVRVRDLEDLKRKQMMSDPEKYKRAAQGDIAYNMMRMWQGAVGVAPVAGLVSPAYVVARPLPGADAKYFSYLFRTDPYKAQSDAFSHGIVKDRNRLYWDDFKTMPSCVPPLDEQIAIRRYLDANGHYVESYVRNRRRLIAALRQLQHVTVSYLSTRAGLDERSGSLADPFRELPKSWSLHRLRHVCSVRFSSVDKVIDEHERSVKLCNYVDVYRNRVISSAIEFSSGSASDAEARVFELREQDVIITKDSESWEDIAVPAYVSEDLPNVICGYHLALLRPNRQIIDGAFLAQVLRAQAVSIQFRVAANGVTRYGLSQGAIKSVLLPIPPISEQKEIVYEIDKQGRATARAVAQLEAEIALILEYRHRLIQDAVLGRLDVRSVASEVRDFDFEPTMSWEAEPDDLDDADAALG